MPGRNGKGPMGMGPMTGRGAGLCQGSQNAGFAGTGRGAGSRRGQGMGFSRGQGMGFSRGGRCWGGQNMRARGGMGFGFGRFADQSEVMEKEALVQHAGNLERELEVIKKRLDDMENAKMD